ncbi:MAG: hypothetical protein CMN30_19770 [Sandaracinus sp.]|nr:hypothetical protein [Sandaracinus sp.]
MRAAWAICKRELRSFFVSPVAYALLVSWLLCCGGNFGFVANIYSSQPAMGGSDNPLTMFFGGTLLFFLPLLVFVPIMTMRLLAQERSDGTLEALLTAPVSERAVVLGKYAAAMIFWAALWVPTLIYVWIPSRFGDVDLGVVAASYLGVMAVGAFYVAIGLLMSALAPNQVVAATLTFLVLVLLFGLGIFQFMAFDLTRDVFSYISIWTHMQDFAKGVVDTRALLFDMSAAALMVFLAVRALEWRRLTS